MQSSKATGVTGHILNTRNDGTPVFRVYDGKTYTDYDLRFDDLLIAIHDKRATLTRGSYIHTP